MAFLHKICFDEFERASAIFVLFRHEKVKSVQSVITSQIGSGIGCGLDLGLFGIVSDL